MKFFNCVIDFLQTNLLTNFSSGGFEANFKNRFKIWAQKDMSQCVWLG